MAPAVNFHLVCDPTIWQSGSDLPLQQWSLLNRFDLRMYSFRNRITNMWNSLPDSVVMADTVNQFENRLDKHWANYVFLYDYRVNYNGTGNLFVV